MKFILCILHRHTSLSSYTQASSLICTTCNRIPSNNIAIDCLSTKIFHWPLKLSVHPEFRVKQLGIIDRILCEVQVWVVEHFGESRSRASSYSLFQPGKEIHKNFKTAFSSREVFLLPLPFFNIISAFLILAICVLTKCYFLSLHILFFRWRFDVFLC